MDYKEGDKVNLLIRKRTDLGYKVSINNAHEGLLYKSDIFQPIEEGEKVEGYVKKIRDDGLIDVCLKPQGYRNVIEINAAEILKKLSVENNFLPINDKSSPKTIQRELNMSKKAFKMAVGFLFRSRKITIEDNGIRLVWCVNQP